MIEQFNQYITNLYLYIPSYVYGWLLLFFCVGLVLVLWFYGSKNGLRYSFRLLIIDYLLLLLCSTIMYRTYQEPPGLDLHPFWSYKAIANGHTQLLFENIMNVVVFLPLGFLMGCAYEEMRWWKSVLICGAFSVVIETLQFVFEKGFTELDDVIHNMVGCLIGYGLYESVTYMIAIYNRRKRYVI